MADDMGYDLAHDLRESAKATFYDPLKSELNKAADHIEKLETALHEAAKLNNGRDRFSADIDALIVNALGEMK
jgi:hypothetical protein